MKQSEAVAEFRRTRGMYQGGISKEVLFEMIVDLKVFSSIEPDNSEEVAKRNYGLALMANMGMMSDEIISRAIDSWVEMAYKENADAE